MKNDGKCQQCHDGVTNGMTDWNCVVDPFFLSAHAR